MVQGSAIGHSSVGVIGFGAFGQLIAGHLSPFVDLLAYDKNKIVGIMPGVQQTDLMTVSKCDIVVLAVPVAAMREVCRAIAPLVRPGALVVDVGSVKMLPAEILLSELPLDVEVAATHPLFGPQSIQGGTAGLKMVICPLRGRSIFRVAGFLRKRFRLHVLFTTARDHDREAAVSQGLTHLIAKVMLSLDHLPERVTTRSYDLLREAVELVRHDASGVTRAIERDNPYSPAVRSDFAQRMNTLCDELSLPGTL